VYFDIDFKDHVSIKKIQKIRKCCIWVVFRINGVVIRCVIDKGSRGIVIRVSGSGPTICTDHVSHCWSPLSLVHSTFQVETKMWPRRKSC